MVSIACELALLQRYIRTDESLWPKRNYLFSIGTTEFCKNVEFPLEFLKRLSISMTKRINSLQKIKRWVSRRADIFTRTRSQSILRHFDSLCRLLYRWKWVRLLSVSQGKQLQKTFSHHFLKTVMLLSSILVLRMHMKWKQNVSAYLIAAIFSTQKTSTEISKSTDPLSGQLFWWKIFIIISINLHSSHTLRSQ